jgi:hypothetical protein
MISELITEYGLISVVSIYFNLVFLATFDVLVLMSLPRLELVEGGFYKKIYTESNIIEAIDIIQTFGLSLILFPLFIPAATVIITIRLIMTTVLEEAIIEVEDIMNIEEQVSEAKEEIVNEIESRIKALKEEDEANSNIVVVDDNGNEVPLNETEVITGKAFNE